MVNQFTVMKRLIFASLLLSVHVIYAQTPIEFTIEMEALTIPNAPGVHSYSWGLTSDQKWVILGGRVDGLHQRQPFAAFLEQDNNKSVYVIDPIAEQVWGADLSVLSTSLFEQLQSTNQQFHQVDTMLYITGGYGYSSIMADHITHPNLAAVSLDQLADAVISGSSITPYFRQISDTRLKVTGGQMGYLNDVFYLVGGNLFDGRYNPQGPGFGPGFIQVYTNDIRAFKIADDGVNLSITDYAATHDTINLHRRDYNMVPQIFPNGTQGFTAFTGVFDYNDLPYLNTVDITPTTYSVNNTFQQYLSQYQSAKLPVYDAAANTMHTVFFGGLSQFTLNASGNLVEDTNVPFVKTISRVTRDPNGDMQEVELSYIEMPVLVGAGSDFIPVDSLYIDHHILDLASVPPTKTHVGYIYGGIQSSAANIFFTNDGSQSFASNTIFKVFINQSVTGLEETTIFGNNVFNLSAYPNPADREINVDFFSSTNQDVFLTITAEDGRSVLRNSLTVQDIGTQTFSVDISELPSGIYFLSISNGITSDAVSFVKK